MRAHGRKQVPKAQQDALTAASLFIVFTIECERFDRTVCTGQLAADGSGVMPRTATETGIIVQHASAMGERLKARAKRFGLDPAVLPHAERFVQAMPYAQVEADYPAALRIIGGPLDG
ncbi:MAG: hypothetical protein QGG14_02870 [Planctomycetota bacterium]|jgi:hypothetical protein|nr:hypothetical protein [Planctomycetota bacterium]|tara:strand:+ start:118 stop:471 length:354 start_codon:yes stop_codon:yes gene_type:complete